jgi:hypothetical protein
MTTAVKDIENKLPALLMGSEYKCANPNKRRAANLRGLAIAVVVRTEERQVSEEQKRVWLDLWEEERQKACEYRMRKWQRDYRRKPHSYAKPDKKDCKPEGWGIRKWLRESLFGKEIDWYRLHRLITTPLNPRPDHNCTWWRTVKDICEDVTEFDPVAEILNTSNEYVKPSSKPAERVTLKKFVEEYCIKQPRPLLKYRRKSLNDASYRKTIELPKPVRKWKSGQPKYYDAGDLIENWPNYCDVLPNLPSLKQEF